MAETKKSGRLFDLMETKGNFQLTGIVTGTKKDEFYTEKQTKNGRSQRKVFFGVEYAPTKTVYVTIQGLQQDYVYFSKRSDKKGEKSEVVKVPWSERHSYNREGFKLIGKNIGVKKKVDENGNLVNDKTIATDFDACKIIKENLADGASVFIKGNVDYSSFTDDKGNLKRYIKLNPNQVSLCANIDLNSDTYKPKNDFNQEIVFMGIEQEMQNNTPSGRYVVSAKIVTYKTIEDAEFFIENKDLALKFKKSLNPYNAIKVNGHIVSSIPKETVSDNDNWGEEDALEKVTGQAKREFIITGAKGSSIDTEIYTEENISEAMLKINQANKAEAAFGVSDDNDWGDTDLGSDDDAAWD